MRRALLPLLGLLLLLPKAALPAAAGDEGRPGRIVLSDGTVEQGRLSFTEGRVLHLTDPETGKGHDVDPARVAALLFRVQRESMERPFTFKTPGSDEKSYGEGTYPLRELLCTVVLVDGERWDGHFKTTVVYVTKPAAAPEAEGAMDASAPPEEAVTKFVLKRQWKGKVGETLDALVYPSEVRFTDVADPGAAALGTLEVTLRGAGALKSATAYGIRSRLLLPAASIDPTSSVVRFESLPEDVYDVFVLGTGIAVAGSVRTPDAKRPIVDAEDLPPVREIVAKGDDLFDQRSLVAFGGDRDGARIVVEKRVTRSTTYDAEFGRRGALAAVDLWTAHRIEKEWRIDARVNPLRIVLAAGEEPPKVLADAKLGAVPVTAGKLSVREADVTVKPTTPPGMEGTR